MNATVTMPISEVDNLRDQIKALTTERDLLAKTKMQVEYNTIKWEPYMDHQVYRNNNGRYEDSVTTQFKQIDNTKVYRGLDEVRAEIRREEELKVSNDLEEMKRERNRVYDQKRKLETKHEEELLQTEAKGEKLAKGLRDVITGLQNEIKELRNEEVEKTKDRTIIELNTEIMRLKKRKWYQILFK